MYISKVVAKQFETFLDNSFSDSLKVFFFHFIGQNSCESFPSCLLIYFACIVWSLSFATVSFSLSTGPISSILVNRYGSRPVMILGGCLSGAGLIAASFCNSVEALYFYVGVVGGLSNGICLFTQWNNKSTKYTVFYSLFSFYMKRKDVF